MLRDGSLKSQRERERHREIDKIERVTETYIERQRKRRGAKKYRKRETERETK